MIADTPSADKRPDWAERLRLPRHDSLAYVQALAIATALVLLSAYVAGRVVADPRRAVKAARARTGI